VSAESDVVVESEFEPALQVVRGERQEEAAQTRRVLQSEPEALERGGGIVGMGQER
jgi:hypothetical protein